jgi:DNA modification methylase
MGSGSTIIASILNNRKGIGIDVDGEYCEIAKKRIFEETKLLNKKLPEMVVKQQMN